MAIVPRRRARAIRTVLAVVTTALAAVAAVVPAALFGAPVGAAADAAITNTNLWLTDAQGRAVILHGLNQVMKVAPYEPAQDGFGADDAAFLQANGFNAMRVGVIWAAVEPQPGVFDGAYLDSIAQTVRTLGEHGIVSLLDFHQDLYNEQFQGEGAPAWAVQQAGLPNPALGFPWNYFGNLAEDHAWDAFWANAPVAGLGLQDHYANAWRSVAARFAGDPNVVGYEVMNEPWPGTLYQTCALPAIGCPAFDQNVLTAFYRKVTTAIRSVDANQTVWVEPNVLFSNFDAEHVAHIDDPHVGWSFHDYCGTASIGLGSLGCATLDQGTISAARNYSVANNVPWLMTEFGATNDLSNLAEMTALADTNRLGWLEWAYTGHDITSSSPDGQALVLDPAQPPTGANVVAAKLKVLAEPYPRAVAGTPTAWSFANGVFRLMYSTATVADPSARFPAGAQTVISTPAVEFPLGYTVSVTGGHVTSPPDAALLTVAADPGATAVSVTVTPR
jgi:endoglycosylceramidase